MLIQNKYSRAGSKELFEKILTDIDKMTDLGKINTKVNIFVNVSVLDSIFN